MARPEDPTAPVPLATLSSELHAATIAAALTDRGIPAQVVGGMLQPLGAMIGPPPGSTVLVQRADLERARSELLAIRSESMDVDWASLDVGAPEAEEPEQAARRGTATGALIAAALGISLVLIFGGSLGYLPDPIGLIAGSLLLVAGLIAAALVLTSSGPGR